MAKILIILAAICMAGLVSADELTAGEVTIRLYTGSTTSNYSSYAIESAEDCVNNSAWNSTKPSVLYVHGLTGSADDDSTVAIVTAYLGIGTYNVLAIDYSTRAMVSLKVVANVGLVGVALGELFNRLVEAEFDLSTIHVIGFGLGPHVAAHAARTVNGTLPRITALDPALPAFYKSGVVHIESTDATIVDVIHADCGILGVEDAIGTVDFYPNSGHALQPGCSIGYTLETIACSSDKSWEYYAASVTYPEGFLAIACDDWSVFVSGSCSSTTDYMGFGYSKNNTGTFYLQTTSTSPYYEESAGIVYEKSTLSILTTALLYILRAIVGALFT